MKKILLSLTFIAVSAMTMAQSVATQSAPANSGNFFVTKKSDKGQERILVGCTLSTAPFTTSLDMYLVAWEPLMLSVKVMNDNSEMVMNWAPSQLNRQYNQHFDISNLIAGTYHMEIYGPDNKKVYTINFDKLDSSNSIGASSR